MNPAEQIVASLDSMGLPGVISVYLFGSHAEGRAHSESDVDLGVLFDREAAPTERTRFERSVRISADLRAATGLENLDLVVLNDAPPLLGRRIATTGHRLICNDSELDHAFVRDIQLLAADIQPFLERMRRIKLEALAPR